MGGPSGTICADLVSGRAIRKRPCLLDGWEGCQEPTVLIGRMGRPPVTIRTDWVSNEWEAREKPSVMIRWIGGPSGTIPADLVEWEGCQEMYVLIG